MDILSKAIEGVNCMEDKGFYNHVIQVDNFKEVEEYSKEWWGHRRYAVTQEDIAHLLKGGYLVFSDREYSTSLKLKD